MVVLSHSAQFKEVSKAKKTGMTLAADEGDESGVDNKKRGINPRDTKRPRWQAAPLLDTSS
jgi:hypothetical protein